MPLKHDTIYTWYIYFMHRYVYAPLNTTYSISEDLILYMYVFI